MVKVRMDDRTVLKLTRCISELENAHKKKLSYRELSSIMSAEFPISKSHLHRLLKAKAQPSVEMAILLANYFGVPFHVLWEHEDLKVLERTT